MADWIEEDRESEPRHIGDILKESLPELMQNWVRGQPGWTAVQRNRAITARNRFMKEHAEWLGIEYVEVPLVKTEEPA